VNHVFWHDDLGFVVDRWSRHATLSNAEPFGPIFLDPILRKAPNFPNISPAPVASWLVARLLRLTDEGLPFEPNATIYNDGGGYHLNFIAFSRNLTPISFFDIYGTVENCRCWGACTSEVLPDALLQTFVDAVLDDPTDLMVCRIVYIDADPPDLPKRRFGKPKVLGWDGQKFLGFEAKGS
jgi:hypothetical protein